MQPLADKCYLAVVPVLQRATLVSHWAELEVKYSEWLPLVELVVVADVWQEQQRPSQESHFLGYSAK